MLTRLRHVRPVAARFMYAQSRSAQTLSQEHITDNQPEQEIGRKVKIFRPAQNSMTSGSSNNDSGWQVKWVVKEKWRNPLMGYTSTRDPLSQVNDFNFESREQAIDYCVKHSLEYEIHDEKSKEKPVKAYEHNYKWKGNVADED